jgi:hypothetical protein
MARDIHWICGALVCSSEPEIIINNTFYTWYIYKYTTTLFAVYFMLQLPTTFDFLYCMFYIHSVACEMGLFYIILLLVIVYFMCIKNVFKK